MCREGNILDINNRQIFKTSSGSESTACNKSYTVNVGGPVCSPGRSTAGQVIKARKVERQTGSPIDHSTDEAE
jgi:hypothetical protein